SFEHVEHTHVSVALCIASAVADVGVGVEAAAMQFGLRFIPLVEESYFLACLTSNIEHPAVKRLRTVLASARWRDILVSLPGYRAPTAPGAVLAVEEALPSWWPRVGSLRQSRGLGPCCAPGASCLITPSAARSGR